MQYLTFRIPSSLANFICKHSSRSTKSGLFHKAIISAGNALVPWAFNDDQVNVGFRIGRRLGFTGDNSEELAEFLRRQPAVALKDAATDEYKNFIQVNISRN